MAHSQPQVTGYIIIPLNKREGCKEKDFDSGNFRLPNNSHSGDGDTELSFSVNKLTDFTANILLLLTYHGQPEELSLTGCRGPKRLCQNPLNQCQGSGKHSPCRKSALCKCFLMDSNPPQTFRFELLIVSVAFLSFLSNFSLSFTFWISNRIEDAQRFLTNAHGAVASQLWPAMRSLVYRSVLLGVK